MKSIRPKALPLPVSMILASALLLTAAMSLTGCAGPAATRTTTATATLQSAQDDYERARLQTEATDESVTELGFSGAEDLEQAYDVFSIQVDRMQELGDRLIAHADGMHFRGASYFVESGKSVAECVFPRSRLPAAGPTAELGEYFNDISAEGWEVKRALRAYLFDISQIRSQLESSTTLRVMETLAPILRKAKADADSLKESLKQASAAVERAKTAKAQAAPTGG